MTLADDLERVEAELASSRNVRGEVADLLRNFDNWIEEAQQYEDDDDQLDHLAAERRRIEVALDSLNLNER